jgi:dihydroorotase
MLKIRNVQLPDDKRVDIIIDGSKIKSVGEVIPSEEGIDGTGLIVIPGVIDPHVHFRIPGGGHKEDWETGSAAALRGGVTTVFDMPNTWPSLTTRKRLEEKREIVSATSKIQARFWFGATKNNLDEIVAVSHEPDIIGVKVFMGSSTGDLLITEENDLRRIFSICAENNLVVGVHAEDEKRMRARRLALGPEPLVKNHYLIRDTLVEIFAVKAALSIAKETGCLLYLCHISTPESLKLALDAKEADLPVFIEVTPLHITLEKSKLQGDNGGYFKMNPPLRTAEQVARLGEFVCNGFVDTIGSDHAPHTRAEKQKEKYDEIPSGVPGVETLLPIMFNLVVEGKLTLERLVSLTSAKAAKIFGLNSKGKIEPGYDADLVLIDPNQTITIRNEDMASKCGWTPYDGMMVKGIPKITIIGGKIMMSR